MVELLRLQSSGITLLDLLLFFSGGLQNYALYNTVTNEVKFNLRFDEIFIS